MEKIIKRLGIAAVAMLLGIGVLSTFTVPSLALDVTEGENAASPTALTTNESETKAEIPGTFRATVDESQNIVEFWAGHNLVLAGNNIKHESPVSNGLLLAAGNTLQLNSETEYGFIFGNTIDFTGHSKRDLFMAGNVITLNREAEIGRDVFAAGNELIVDTDINGDLAVSAEKVIIKDSKIGGNVNLDVVEIIFDGKVEIAGALTYNDNAEVTGLENASYNSIEAYHVVEVNQAALVMAAIYGKILSVASLFIVMAVLGAVYHNLHNKIAEQSDANRTGMNLVAGLVALVVVPIISLLLIMTVVGAPLAIILLALYVVMIYLSQGFAGVWLGHLIIEKAFKSKANIYAEAFVGILILGALALVPYLGVATGFLGLVLGLGLIMQCVKPRKAVKA